MNADYHRDSDCATFLPAIDVAQRTRLGTLCDSARLTAYTCPRKYAHCGYRASAQGWERYVALPENGGPKDLASSLGRITNRGCDGATRFLSRSPHVLNDGAPPAVTSAPMPCSCIPLGRRRPP